MNSLPSYILGRARPALRLSSYVCPQCRRSLSTTTGLNSGHSRWSKIKHEKGSNDLVKNRERSRTSQEIYLASKMFGPDPQFNPRLASILAIAKKAGTPRASIEQAIARGQGMSASGAPLESLLIEAIIPPAVSMIVEALSDNRLRTMADLRMKIKDRKGTSTPTAYMFTRRGRIVLERDERGLAAEDVLDEAVEAGAEDVEMDKEGNVVVYTEATQTTSAAKRLEESLKMKIQSADMIWSPNPDTMVELETEEEMKAVEDLVAELEDSPEVQGVYLNIAPDMSK